MCLQTTYQEIKSKSKIIFEVPFRAVPTDKPCLHEANQPQFNPFLFTRQLSESSCEHEPRENLGLLLTHAHFTAIRALSMGNGMLKENTVTMLDVWKHCNNARLLDVSMMYLF